MPRRDAATVVTTNPCDSSSSASTRLDDCSTVPLSPRHSIHITHEACLRCRATRTVISICVDILPAKATTLAQRHLREASGHGARRMSHCTWSHAKCGLSESALTLHGGCCANCVSNGDKLFNSGMLPHSDKNCRMEAVVMGPHCTNSFLIERSRWPKQQKRKGPRAQQRILPRNFGALRRTPVVAKSSNREKSP